MNVSYNLPHRDFYELLFDFAERVKKNEYKKMDYSVWKELNHLSSHIITVNFYLNEATPHVEIISDGYYTAFTIREDNFGEYLDTMRIRDGVVNWVNYIDVDSVFTDNLAATNTLAAKNTIDTISIDNLSLSDMDAKTVTIKPNDYTWHNTSTWHDYDTTTAIGNYGSMYVTKEELEYTQSSIRELEDLIATKADKADTYATALAAKADYMQPTITFDNNRKEDKFMKNFNFDFGPMNGNVVRMSMYGLAVKDKTGSYVSYDAKNGEIMNVDIINFDGADFLYKMPVAIKDISIGDIVIHQNVPMFVVDVSKDNKALVAIDPIVGERKEIMLARSPFGFNFATKVVNLLGNAFGTAASADNPFGNMWMLLAMNEGSDMSAMLPMMMFAQGGTADPTMAMAMMAMSQKDGKSNMSSILPMMWMMNNTKPAAPCTCGCHKDA